MLAQDKVSIKILASGYGSGGGLIGAVIDASVTANRLKDAKNQVQPLLKEINDLDVRAKFWEKLTPAIKSPDWPRIVEVKTTSTPTVVTDADVKDSALIVLDTSYVLSPNAAVLEMHTFYRLYVQGSTSVAAVGQVSFWSKQIGKSVDGKEWKEGQEAVALWAADGGTAFRATIDEGIAETVRMLRVALPYLGGRNVAGLGERRIIKYNVINGRGDFGINSRRSAFSGRILDRAGDRIIFQLDRGPVYSVPSAEVEEQKAS